jgi:tetratricopeptide (TPR) repeat protein
MTWLGLYAQSGILMPEDSTFLTAAVPARRFSAAHAAALALILLAGAGLRCWQLDRESIWWDEFTSVVHLDPPTAWQASPDYIRWNQSVIRDTAPSLLAFWKQNRSMDPATMPMYYTFEYLWTRYVSNDFETLRYLSILISMLVLPAGYLLGRTFFGRGAGLIVMLCVALSPIHWQFSREIRMYGLMTLLAALSVWTFVRLVRGGGRRWWAGHGAATLLLLWTHPFAVLVPFTEGVFWALCFPCDWRRIARWVALMALAAVPISIYVASIHFWEQGHTDSWMKVPTLSEFTGDLFADDAVGMTYQLNATPTLWEKVVNPDTAMKIIRLRWTVGRWWVSAVLLSVALLTGASFFRRRRALACSASGDGDYSAKAAADAPCRWNFFLLLWFLLPPVMLYLASLVWRPCIMPRYTLHSSLALYLVFAGAVTMIRWRAVRAALVILLMAFYGYQHSLILGDPQHPDWKSACARLHADANPDDLVLVHNWLWKRVFAYNLGPVPNVVSYGTGYDVLAEECSFFTGLNLPSKSGKGPRIPWVLVQTDYFTGGAILDLEAEFRTRGLSFQSWEYGGIQHVMLYRVWREPGAVVPDYRAKSLSGEPPREFGDLSLEYWRAGEYGTAELAARKAIELDPKYTKGWSYLGMALKEAGRTEEALAAFQEAVRLDYSGYPWSHVNIAMLLLDLGRYGDAVDATLRALELLPNDPWAHTVLASAYLGAGRIDEAVKTAEKAVSLDPGDQRAKVVLEKARAAKAGAAVPQ